MDNKEKIKEAKRLYESANDDQKYVLEILFPELKEREEEINEKIRIGLIKAFNTIGKLKWGGLNVQDVLTWLEKPQGKSALDAWKDMRLEVYQQASGNRHEPNYSDDSTKMFSLNDIDEIIEKISEQSHNDKVEPKFKVGDWIVQEKIGVYKVIEICESWYEVVDNKDKHYSIGFDKEYMCHLWTIEDASAGDVLVCETDEIEWIFIYREIVPSDSVVPHDLLRYYFLLEGNYFNCNGVSAMITDDYELYLKPATKEQRDLLFTKMKEEGYEWDAERKELKKIEVTSKESEDEKIRKQLITHFRNTRCVTEKGGGITAKWITWLEKQGERESIWSEEDESWFKELELMVLSFSNDVSYRKEFFDWLKSLKQRIGG